MPAMQTNPTHPFALRAATANTKHRPGHFTCGLVPLLSRLLAITLTRTLKHGLAPIAVIVLAPWAAHGADDAAWVRLKDPMDTAVVKAGETIFSNRPYVFESFPKELEASSRIETPT